MRVIRIRGLAAVLVPLLAGCGDGLFRPRF